MPRLLISIKFQSRKETKDKRKSSVEVHWLRPYCTLPVPVSSWVSFHCQPIILCTRGFDLFIFVESWRLNEHTLIESSGRHSRATTYQVRRWNRDYRQEKSDRTHPAHLIGNSNGILGMLHLRKNGASPPTLKRAHYLRFADQDTIRRGEDSSRDLPPKVSTDKRNPSDLCCRRTLKYAHRLCDVDL